MSIEMTNSKSKKNNQSGFSLIEAVMAVVILLIALLGVFGVFTYAIIYNTGNNSRSQALSVLQKEIEIIRAAKFTSAYTDSTITGGVKAAKNISAADGSSYRVDVTVDDDPLTPDVQIDTSKSLKEITIVITPNTKLSEWQNAVITTTVMRRVRGN